MIFTVTPNPTLDKTIAVSHLVLGEVNRARLLRVDLGGKGINVSRALRSLGLESRLTGFLSGGTGETMRRGLIAAGYDADFLEISGETRQNITLLDEATGVYTKINEPGPAVGPQDSEALIARVRAKARAGDIWVFSGSLPPGASEDLYARLIDIVQSAGGRAFLDSSGEALRQGCRARPYGLKPNVAEAEEVLGRRLPGESEQVEGIRQLLASGIALVALSRGAQGVLLGASRLETAPTGGTIVRAVPPVVEVRSNIGAGDSVVAALVWSTERGLGPEEMARWAVAAGTATAMQEGTAVGSWEQISALAPHISVKNLIA
jgi:1-phosphofructokinase